MTAPSRPSRAVSLRSLLGATYVPMSFGARFPYAMMIIGVLTLVLAARDSIQAAGMISALVGLGTAVAAPVIGASADRLGQRPTLLVTTTVNAAAMCVLAWVAYSPAPLIAVYALGLVTGATAPQISPMSRSRIVAAATTHPSSADDRARLISRGLSVDTMLDEVSFVFGPVAVGATALAFGGWVPMVVAAVTTLGFGWWFALHPTAPAPRPRSEASTRGHREVAPLRDVARLRILITVAGIAGLGMLFGSTLTALSAQLQPLGLGESAGLWYSVMGVGSAIMALAVAWLPTSFSLNARWVSFGACVTAGSVIFFLVPGTIGAITGLALMGIGVGPTLVTLYGLAADRSPEGWSSTVMTMLSSGMVLGQALAAAVTGWLAESAGPGRAAIVPCAAGVVILISGIVNALRCSPVSNRSTPVHPPVGE